MFLSMPYIDKVIDKHTRARYFSNDIDFDELVWHRDKRSRKVKVMSGYDWFLQFDNQMPIELVVGQTYNIEKGSYHRLMKGDKATDLWIKITENND